jgi:L-amino acid N-acyltransferase YncA
LNNLTFREAEEKDVEPILDIYNYYIVKSTATFDIDPITKDELRSRFFVNQEKYPIFLILLNNELIGFCFLTQFKKKPTYERTAEAGLYFKPQYTNKGFGKEAVSFLEQVAISKQIKVIVACICAENLASIKLFQKTGFEQCAHYKAVGEKFGRVLDVVDFQKMF